MSYRAIMFLTALIVAVVAYLIGSISFSIIFTHAYTRKDIRKFGSGNAGLTNVLRSVGPEAGVLTFIGDFGKGVLCTLVGLLAFKYLTIINGSYLIDPMYGRYIGGIFGLLGHIFPAYYGFKGGKGVLISAGILGMIDWRIFLIVVPGIFLFTFLTTRIVSLASIVAAVSYPIVTFLMFSEADKYIDQINAFFIDQRLFETLFGVLFALIVVITHIPNIKRLLKGQEKRMKFKRSQKIEAEDANV